jgi:hypothetical protein
LLIVNEVSRGISFCCERSEESNTAESPIDENARVRMDFVGVRIVSRPGNSGEPYTEGNLLLTLTITLPNRIQKDSIKTNSIYQLNLRAIRLARIPKTDGMPSGNSDLRKVLIDSQEPKKIGLM